MARMIIDEKMAEPPLSLIQKLKKLKEHKLFKIVAAVTGIMSMLIAYGYWQEKIMRVSYGPKRNILNTLYFLYYAIALQLLLYLLQFYWQVTRYWSLLLQFTSTVLYHSLIYLLQPVSMSFPVQTLAKCAKMIPIMIWGTAIMKKTYAGRDYLFAFLVTVGCSIFVLNRAADEDIGPSRGRDSTVWGVSLMIGYLGVDGFTSTFQDKLFKGYDMDIQNQIFYTSLCSCMVSLFGLIIQGNLPLAIDFVSRHNDCLLDIAILSTVSTISQFFIFYTIHNFGALVFATIMTTRQMVSIYLSCVWFSHPLSPEQLIGAVIVFGSIYAKSLFKSNQRSSSSEQTEIEVSGPPRASA